MGLSQTAMNVCALLLTWFIYHNNAFHDLIVNNNRTIVFRPTYDMHFCWYYIVYINILFSRMVLPFFSKSSFTCA